MRLQIVFLLLFSFLDECHAKTLNDRRGVYQFPISYENADGFMWFWTRIAVGSPPQVTKVGLVFSGTNLPVVLERHCTTLAHNLNETNYMESPCASEKFTYNPDISKTVKRTGLLCDTSCMDGPHIGEIMYDRFGFGDPNSASYLQMKQSVKFGSSRYILNIEYPTLGLAIPTDSFPGNNLLYAAWKEGLLKDSLYSLHYRRCSEDKNKECDNAGTFVLGGIDKDNCEPAKALYQTKCDNSTYNATTFGANSFQILNPNGDAFELFDQTDKATYIAVLSEVPGLDIPEKKATKLFKFLGAEYDEEGRYGSMPCGSKFQVKLTVMYQELTITSRDLFIRKDEKRRGNCQLDMFPIPDDPEYPQNIKYRIGRELLHEYCVTMDFKEGFIGFGAIKNKAF